MKGYDGWVIVDPKQMYDTDTFRFTRSECIRDFQVALGKGYCWPELKRKGYACIKANITADY